MAATAVGLTAASCLLRRVPAAPTQMDGDQVEVGQDEHADIETQDQACSSQHGAFTATLVPAQKLSVGKTQQVSLAVVDKAGSPVDSANITINGGMPQHGHGLPTRPQVRPGDAAGRYTIAGLRFNMGGWWVVSFVIRAPSAAGQPAKADSVTFNIRL